MTADRIKNIAGRYLNQLPKENFTDKQLREAVEQAIKTALLEVFSEPVSDKQADAAWKTYCASESPYEGIRDACAASLAEKAKQWK